MKINNGELTFELDANGYQVFNLLALVLSQNGDDIRVRKDGSGSIEFYNDADSATIFGIDQDSGKVTVEGDIDLQGSNGLVNVPNQASPTAGDMNGEVVIDGTNNKLLLKDDSGNQGEITLDTNF